MYALYYKDFCSKPEIKKVIINEVPLTKWKRYKVALKMIVMPDEVED